MTIIFEYLQAKFSINNSSSFSMKPKRARFGTPMAAWNWEVIYVCVRMWSKVDLPSNNMFVSCSDPYKL